MAQYNFIHYLTTRYEVINNKNVVYIDNINNYIRNSEWTNLCSDICFTGFTNIQKTILIILDYFITSRLCNFVIFENLTPDERYIF